MDDARFAAEYLRLRMEAFRTLCPLLAEHSDMRWDQMVKVLERRQATGHLAPEDVRRIVSIENGVQTSGRTWLSHQNLLDLYTVLCQLNHLDREHRKGFFNNLRKRIGERHFLTELEVAAAIRAGVQIREDAFAWAYGKR